MLALPDPNTLRAAARGRGDDAPVGPDVLRHPAPLDGTPFEGDPRHVLQRNLDRAREQGLHVLRRARDGVLLLRSRPTRRPSRSTTPAYFDLTTADMASDLRKQTILTLEAMGIPVEYSFHEDSPSQHEIDLRYTDALTMADNVMTFRLVVKEIAQRARRVRHVHAEADRAARAGLGHAHALLAVRGRRQRVPRPGRRVRAVEGRQALHRRPAAPRARDHRGHQPVGELLQAARSSATRRPVYVSLGAQQPRRRSCGVPRAEEGQGRARPASSSARPTRPATRTSRSRWCSRPGSRASRRATSSRPRPRTTSTR